MRLVHVLVFGVVLGVSSIATAAPADTCRRLPATFSTLKGVAEKIPLVHNLAQQLHQRFQNKKPAELVATLHQISKAITLMDLEEGGKQPALTAEDANTKKPLSKADLLKLKDEVANLGKKKASEGPASETPEAAKAGTKGSEFSGQYWGDEPSTQVDTSTMIKRARTEYITKAATNVAISRLDDEGDPMENFKESEPLPTENLYRGVNHFAISNYPNSVMAKSTLQTSLKQKPGIGALWKKKTLQLATTALIAFSLCAITSTLLCMSQL